MTELFAPKLAEPWRLPITKAHLRGVIWMAALAVFVLLPRPDAAEASRPLVVAAQN
jgi:hypothetical protein